MNRVLCEHNWIQGNGVDSDACFTCTYYPATSKRAQCNICYMVSCIFCLEKQGVNITPEVKSKVQKLSELQYDSLLKRFETLEARITLLERQQSKGKGIVINEPDIEQVCVDITSPDNQCLSIPAQLPARRNTFTSTRRDITCHVNIYPEANFVIKTFALIDSGCT